MDSRRLCPGVSEKIVAEERSAVPFEIAFAIGLEEEAKDSFEILVGVVGRFPARSADALVARGVMVGAARDFGVAIILGLAVGVISIVELAEEDRLGRVIPSLNAAVFVRRGWGLPKEAGVESVRNVWEVAEIGEVGNEEIDCGEIGRGGGENAPESEADPARINTS